MSGQFDTAAAQGGAWQNGGAWQQGGAWQRRGCGMMGWRPLEIAAMVVGFAIWWPIGLAVIGYKVAQRKGYAMPDWMGAAKTRFADAAGDFSRGRGAPWRPFEQSSGNAAFDDWRKAELAKLEEERRKLETAEKEFAAHMDNLRRARDREEFEAFMAARRGPTTSV